MSTPHPSAFITRTGNVTCCGVHPSYRWKRPSIATTGLPASVPHTSRPLWLGAVLAGKCGTCS